MKLFFHLGIFLISFGVGEVWANPFHSSLVCVPRMNPSESLLEFRIRESTACGEGETLLKVYQGKDGTVLLYPTSPTLAPEEEADLKRFKEFYGITR